MGDGWGAGGYEAAWVEAAVGVWSEGEGCCPAWGLDHRPGVHDDPHSPDCKSLPQSHCPPPSEEGGGGPGVAQGEGLEVEQAQERSDVLGSDPGAQALVQGLPFALQESR